ncbi:MAG: glycoside hydrolase family 97 C-terminal domain-containing protein, partial [Gemmatimonadota bacterium]|nr:glycoside hydrolase family 97 C-terminal domain-containing protein [Gemmatimonadota bacterium]
RNGADWYIGAITDEESRTFEVPLAFLQEGRDYIAEVYSDETDAHWLTNPLAISISELNVDASSVITINLAPGGGQAIRIRALQ